MGIDKVGIDKVGIDEVGRYREITPCSQAPSPLPRYSVQLLCTGLGRGLQKSAW